MKRYTLVTLRLPDQGSFIAEAMARRGDEETGKEACLFHGSVIPTSA